MRCEHISFSIIPKDGKEELEEVPLEVMDLLEEFPNIVSNKVPNGLWLVWNISHQMDLILGANFPNKAMHRMTLEESEELNSQVKD